MTEQRALVREPGVGRLAKFALPYVAKAFANRFATQANSVRQISIRELSSETSGIFYVDIISQFSEFCRAVALQVLPRKKAI